MRLVGDWRYDGSQRQTNVYSSGVN
jgi:hypothetical protein